MSNVLVIGDIHQPFTHPNYLKFLLETQKRFQCDTVVFIGDIVDNYAHSRFAKDPDSPSAQAEYDEFMIGMRKYYDAFPEAIWIIGNHDKRPFLKLKEAGLGRIFTKGYDTIYDCPVTWKIVPSYQIDGVLYTHGVACGGQTGWQNYSRKLGKSVVFGHIHSVGGVRYHQNPDGKQVFSLSVASGVNDEAYAFEYGRDSPTKSMLGCGIVRKGTHAYFEPMDLTDRRFRRIR